MDQCAIKVDRNEKSFSENFIKVKEKTLDTSKKEDGEAGNVSNKNIKFY